MTAKKEAIDETQAGGTRASRWAFAALIAGNVALSLGAMLVGAALVLIRLPSRRAAPI
ncbi:hypothetical protein [Sphingopyxis sp.]|uniref:hypothetical protein n=1 Tax=Sphingopyxis sp. TaxID=1908224 RepID=UPI002FCA3214